MTPKRKAAKPQQETAAEAEKLTQISIRVSPADLKLTDEIVELAGPFALRAKLLREALSIGLAEIRKRYKAK